MTKAETPEDGGLPGIPFPWEDGDLWRLVCANRWKHGHASPRFMTPLLYLASHVPAPGSVQPHFFVLSPTPTPHILSYASPPWGYLLLIHELLFHRHTSCNRKYSSSACSPAPINLHFGAVLCTAVSAIRELRCNTAGWLKEDYPFPLRNPNLHSGKAGSLTMFRKEFQSRSE